MGEKRFLTYDEQITFLEKEKGLIISNKEYAKKILLKIGYFPKSRPIISFRKVHHLKIFMNYMTLIII